MVVMIFVVSGVIMYSAGIAMFLGGGIGSYIGAHYSDRIGNVWVKRLFVVLVALMAVRLFL